MIIPFYHLSSIYVENGFEGFYQKSQEKQKKSTEIPYQNGEAAFTASLRVCRPG